MREDAKDLGLTRAVFTLSMTIALSSQLANISVPEILSFGIALFWILLSAAGMLKTGLAEDHRRLFGLFVTPRLFIWLYTFSLLVLGLVDGSNLGSGIQLIIMGLLPFSCTYLLGVKGIDSICDACIISFAFSIPFTVLMDGPQALAAPIVSIFDETAANPFETHAFTFTVGYLFIYYSCIKQKGTESSSRARFAMSLVMMLFGFKRILLLAVVLVVLFTLVIDRLPARQQRLLSLIVFVAIFGVSWFYVVAVKTGLFDTLVASFGIDTMGRVFYYDAILQNAPLDPTFLGFGYNAVSGMLSTTYSYLKVGGLHSDILKMYVELGAIGFTVWMGYYLFLLPYLIEKYYGTQAHRLMAILTVFSFVLFFTDNTDTYLGSQLLLYGIPMMVIARQCRISPVCG